MATGLDKAFEIAHQKAQKASWSNVDAQNMWGVPNTADECWKFIRKLHTWDEASELEAPFPDEGYLEQIVQHWYECRESGRRLVIEKSRRLLVSYLMCAIELFQLGHGRKNLLIMHLDLAKAQKEVWRIYQLYESYRKRHDPRLPELKQGENMHGNAASQQLERIMLPNGSIVDRHHQSGGAARGTGYSLIRVEELSMYQYPLGTWGQAKILTQGKPDEGVTGGFSYAIANSSPAPDWLALKHGTRARDILEEGVGMVHRTLADGTLYLVVHYTANSGMTAEWAETALRDIPQQERRREYELYDDVFDGRPVYPMYVDHKHWPQALRTGPIPYIEGSLLIAGLDCGTAINVAGVLLMVTPNGQMIAVREVCPIDPLPISELIMSMQAEIMDFAGSMVSTVTWVADSTIKNRTGSRNETAMNVARQETGVRLIPVSNALKPRLDAVVKALSDEVATDAPRFIIDGYCCPHLRKGLQGAYRWRERLSDSGSRIISEPLKDEFSHVQDSLQYAVQYAWKQLGRMLITAEAEEEDERQGSYRVSLGQLVQRGRTNRRRR